MHVYMYDSFLGIKLAIQVTKYHSRYIIPTVGLSCDDAAARLPRLHLSNRRWLSSWAQTTKTIGWLALRVQGPWITTLTRESPSKNGDNACRSGRGEGMKEGKGEGEGDSEGGKREERTDRELGWKEHQQI